ncbi:Copper binding protein, plastocyanin/azurin family [Alloactinosynnema sp. L-07]|uniref:carboxypeptidase regulatory-like domain-containing protein n=1 Tax=Alloactinosynnema sp. L-07 TaxID=1653480 RepID=UPI00065F06D0|nr:carboxypeptidase regulatory-like domain-containing protein [Alloactinosynnema sp. L-07]CRK58561.1 Copper binding protein, plastocyanin/azurin family [Alloactinosynnema sp. L-07]
MLLPRHRPSRVWLVLITAFLSLFTMITVPASAAPDSTSKIEESVTEALEAKDSADFWVYFTEQADLSGPSRITDWNDRGQAVLDALRGTADRVQAAARADLEAARADYQSFFIANALHVRGGTTALAESLANRSEVASILASHTYSLPSPQPADPQGSVNAVEWGLSAINADDVWSGFGVQGEGIVVGNIDSGVQFDHPALAAKYRGNTGAGTFDHNYNWFDPSRVCAGGTPCDNNGHGTHTMGTMVGGDGANQIGVAPGARWIAAKGCESNSCSEAALLASGQWMLAPTDSTNANPRPDLRPHVVNNSWGSSNGGAVDLWYSATVNAWRAAGIFPSFSNGNAGPNCNTSGSPGDYSASYSSGAFDINGVIASFSSRGPGQNGDVKPNLAAPGVSVRSSIPGNGYAANSGTSMASPHTSGTVALMWSSAPTLVGDIARTEELLNDTAVDVDNLTCGGTADDNNVFGEGKLDAYAAVDRSPRGPVGTLAGTITDSATGTPISGARVDLVGPSNRSLLTTAAGAYTSTLPVGDYTVTASAFGYGRVSGTVTVTDGQAATHDVALTAQSRATVSGVVRSDTGAAVANATVRIAPGPIPAVTTGADGSYSISNVPHGDYQLTASAGGCSDPRTQALTVDGAETVDLVLPSRSDSFGHRCRLEAASYVEGDTPVTLTGDDAATSVALPFDFFFYGNTYRDAHLATNGHVNFLARSTAYANAAIPGTTAPNAALYPFWDDLLIDASSRVMTKTIGTAPNRDFVIEWRNATFYQATTTRVDIETVLSENGEISYRYRNLDTANPRETGNSATVGIENATGTVALQYSLNSSVLADAQAIRFIPPASGVLTGNVTDANDTLPVAGAIIRALNGTTEVARTTSAADGTYRLRLLAADYTLEVAKQNYVTSSAPLTLDGDVTANIALDTPRAELNTTGLTFLAEAGQLRTATLPLRSTSELSLDYTLTNGASWLWAVPGTASVKPGTSQNLVVRVDPIGLVPGVHDSTVTLATNAGRTPTLTVPVRLVVPEYRKGINVGGPGLTDRNTDVWVDDQRWEPGGFGYLSGGPVVTTRKAIAGTDDDALFQSQRESAGGYRFDLLPAGTYQVQLNFAELTAFQPVGKRVFDVSINGTKVLPNYDIAARVGTLTADVHEFWVTVPEGGSIAIELAALRGKKPPVLNAVRVTHRPDRTS